MMSSGGKPERQQKTLSSSPASDHAPPDAMRALIVPAVLSTQTLAAKRPLPTGIVLIHVGDDESSIRSLKQVNTQKKQKNKKTMD
jgi:hypothetical protein